MSTNLKGIDEALSRASLGRRRAQKSNGTGTRLVVVFGPRKMDQELVKLMGTLTSHPLGQQWRPRGRRLTLRVCSSCLQPKGAVVDAFPSSPLLPEDTWSGGWARSGLWTQVSTSPLVTVHQKIQKKRISATETGALAGPRIEGLLGETRAQQTQEACSGPLYLTRINHYALTHSLTLRGRLAM